MTIPRRCAVVAALLLGAWVARARLGAPQPAPDAPPLSRFPIEISSWRGEDAPLAPEVVKVAAVDDYMNRTYESGDNIVGLYVGYYRSQREGEALHSPMQCLPGAGWVPTRTESLQLASAAGQPHVINKLMVEKGIDRMLVLYWYQTLNRVTASEYMRKLLLVKDAMGSGRTDVALVRIIAPLDVADVQGEARALNVTRSFAERVLPQIQQQLFRE